MGTPPPFKFRAANEWYFPTTFKKSKHQRVKAGLLLTVSEPKFVLVLSEQIRSCSYMKLSQQFTTPASLKPQGLAWPCSCFAPLSLSLSPPLFPAMFRRTDLVACFRVLVSGPSDPQTPKELAHLPVQGSARRGPPWRATPKTHIPLCITLFALISSHCWLT